MVKFYLTILVFISTSMITFSQLLLEADGPGSTYELISSKLAPGYNPVEHPECIHPEFGRHIAEVFDSTLNKYVFEFYSHVTPDNDRCIKFDRQRVEIKTYDQSPDSLLGIVGETITYKWKFKLAVGYQPSSSFTHIHQIKAVGGDDGNPIFTLTPRKATPNKMELIHNNTTKVRRIDLSLFEGNWVECTETIYIHPTSGNYSMLITNVASGDTILDYSNYDLMTIRPDNDFIRPKWGIYRSLNAAADLRDEAVRFSDFSIQEQKLTDIDQSKKTLPQYFSLEQNYPNPFNPNTTISYSIPIDGIVNINVYDILGNQVIQLENKYTPAGKYSKSFDASKLVSGIYFYSINIGSFIASKKMILMK